MKSPGCLGQASRTSPFTTRSGSLPTRSWCMKSRRWKPSRNGKPTPRNSAYATTSSGRLGYKSGFRSHHGHLANANEAVSTTAGHLIESDIGYYLKGIPGSDISWFPARHKEPEIDFVLTLGLQRIPIEVKYRRRRPEAGDLAGLASFCNQTKYNAPFGLLITQELSGALGEQVVALPAYALLSVR